MRKNEIYEDLQRSLESVLFLSPISMRKFIWFRLMMMRMMTRMAFGDTSRFAFEEMSVNGTGRFYIYLWNSVCLRIRLEMGINNSEKFKFSKWNGKS